MSIGKIYTIDEIMDMLKVTRRTVYNYIKYEGLRAFKIGKYLKVHESDLKQFFDSQVKRTETPAIKQNRPPRRKSIKAANYTEGNNKP
jgi:excisionase family DNA binding protein